MSRKYALLICNCEYTDETLSRLTAPNQDAEALAEVLRNQQLCKFDEVNVLSNKTSSLIIEAIADFFNEKKRDDLLLLYFSGHGVLDANGFLYLAANNTKRRILRATSIPSRFITDEMDNCRSHRQILVLDCCHSGAFSRGSKGVIGQNVGTASIFQGNGYGRVVLTATDATQYAWEGAILSGENAHSVFTYHLVEGLRTGDADLDRDGTITIDELYDYVYGKIVGLKSEKPQTPGKWSYKGQGRLALAENLNTTDNAQLVTNTLWQQTSEIIYTLYEDRDSWRRLVRWANIADDIMARIDFNGSAISFTNKLIETLVDDERLYDGKSSIVAVLSVIKRDYPNHSNRVDELIDKWTKLFALKQGHIPRIPEQKYVVIETGTQIQNQSSSTLKLLKDETAKLLYIHYDDNYSYRRIVNDAGIDGELFARINFNGSVYQVAHSVIDTLLLYNHLYGDKPSIVALLTVMKYERPAWASQIDDLVMKWTQFYSDAK